MRSTSQSSPSLLGIIFKSEVANWIIFVNFGVYVLLALSPNGFEIAEALVLYPENLVRGRYYTFITTAFVHSNLTHLLLNMLGVFIFARIVEKHLGVFKTFVVYFGALVFSMVFATLIYSLLLDKSMGIVGASGAVMGLVAAAILLDPFSVTYETIIPLPTMMKGWLFLFADIKGFLGGEQGGVSHLAHLLGFISIGLLMYLLSSRDRKDMKAGLIVNIISFIIFVLIRELALNKFS